ncbi:hypothetical protein BE1S18E01_30130 [Acinetobacter sp. BEC1-S18-ESBL-01]|jgi:hypothetical protein|uniref:hypothetical protein n=1 Tax=Acinetobacter TaxID=469 RepID=UPI0002CEDBD0|nr:MULTISPECIES: hypothetical protein [Acinetobacter]AMO41685.1 hypothetical protein A0J50_14290 [Acinetobacter sp. DUT-2]ENW13856.1 hypothetical protein F930_00531 [Acinetobacter pittii ANC 3678]MCU4472017.1 hypothetical protein [Acinetobacter pittii]MCU4486743.1 hypothetical protein [Acinetobacter pittii]MDR3039444.1 hypothetical protein [Acinetobacter pittii]
MEKSTGALFIIDIADTVEFGKVFFATIKTVTNSFNFAQVAIKYALPYLQVDFAMVQSRRTGA